ncbi:MAG: hypothetical protein GX628_10010 [Clostridiales bacterium]|nr:hypothetical protein [Clostridiales bacterium]
MKFAVGYQLAEGNETPFSELISDYTDKISEVYFPWLDIATGRSAIATRHGATDWTSQARLEGELVRFREMGIKLDLLLNANCYGRLSMSEELRNRVGSLLEYLKYQSPVGGVDIVTTASPFIAETVKKYFPEIDVRASVNMWLGTVKSMSYLADIFDSFYVQREYNRDIPYILELKKWCDEHGKGLYMLANSGCFSYCTGHSFHDNLVAHEAEIAETKNVSDFMPYTCWRYLKKRENWHTILQNSWVRPEDIHNYEGIISTVKLATRMHARPLMVIDAYCRGRFYGNLPDLMEPGFAPAIEPYIIDNKALPDDFFERTSTCDRRCHSCDYCKNALEAALIKMEP